MFGRDKNSGELALKLPPELTKSIAYFCFYTRGIVLAAFFKVVVASTV
ncbi:hypothetical protein KPSA1_03570 [Pseudomonas syringae pv. actinidiae]|uniref:Uncharacterized protein n=1 Tax=Pseudomonas syringae pv. actinidiae TaxID=103796 RepID=A0A2V0QB03_PSESF|nr:hypothetical protein KPSA1_03570 [Pseudomonas syringae pv. actinidiae]